MYAILTNNIADILHLNNISYHVTGLRTVDDCFVV